MCRVYDGVAPDLHLYRGRVKALLQLVAIWAGDKQMKAFYKSESPTSFSKRNEIVETYLYALRRVAEEKLDVSFESYLELVGSEESEGLEDGSE